MVGSLSVSIIENLKHIRGKVESAQKKSQYAAKNVVIIGVSKLQPVDVILEGVSQAGISDLGENYVQEFQKKEPLIRNVRWHMIGPIQTNKARFVVGHVHLIHTVDRENLVTTLSRVAEERKVVQDVLIQVNVAGEDSKNGTTPQGARQLIPIILVSRGLRLRGLMTMPPYTENAEASRLHFRKLRETLLELNKEFNLEMDVLSMGTSQDYEVAIEEGATHVRIGTTLFGSRGYV